MTRPNENALTPASLATDGEQGEGAKANGHCEAQHSPQSVAALFLTRVALHDGHAQLEAYALSADDPYPGTVEAADLLGARCNGRRAMTGPRLTGNRCQCPTCGLPFSSVREFDRHRVGTYATPGQVRGNRRCLTVAELQARGWRTNARGFYMQPRLERAPAGISGPRMTLPATGVQGVMR